MSQSVIMLTLSRLEARTLADLVAQFRSLLDESDSQGGHDPALARLSPDVYPDDASASAEFRASTHEDVLDRRSADAETVQRTLVPSFSGDDSDPVAMLDIALARDEADAWLRTLAAVRLVIASRLGITTDDEAERAESGDDERFAVYDWLGYRLDGLVTALESDE